MDNSNVGVVFISINKKYCFEMRLATRAVYLGRVWFWIGMRLGSYTTN